MKNRHYGNVWKNTIILLQLLFSVLLLMSVFMVAALNGKHMIDMDNLTNQSYVDSSYYSYVYEQKVTELTNFLMTRKNFETNGEYDSEKPVNVIKYARSGIIRNDAEESYTMTLVRNGASAYWMYDDSSIPIKSRKNICHRAVFPLPRAYRRAGLRKRKDRSCIRHWQRPWTVSARKKLPTGKH